MTFWVFVDSNIDACWMCRMELANFCPPFLGMYFFKSSRSMKIQCSWTFVWYKGFIKTTTRRAGGKPHFYSLANMITTKTGLLHAGGIYMPSVTDPKSKKSKQAISLLMRKLLYCIVMYWNLIPIETSDIILSTIL